MKFDLNHPISFSLPSSLLTLLLLLLLLLLQNPIPVSGYGRWQFCTPTIANSTKYNALRPNLNTLLSSLSNNTPPTGFFNNTVGTIPANQVYGLALCQGDLAPAQCWSCIDSAAREIVLRCPNAEGAVIWYDDCLMRYNTTNFFGSRMPDSYHTNSPDNVSDPGQLSVVVDSLTTPLIRKAADSPLLFATAEANFTGGDDQKLYSLAQCTRDLTPGSCYDCLKDLKGYFAVNAWGRKGSKMYQGSCVLRYEVYAFYKANISAPDSPPSTTIPKPSITGKKNNSTKTIVIIVILSVALATIIVASIPIYICLWRRKNTKEMTNRDVEIENAEFLSFDLGLLKTATSDFSQANKLGEGGFGQVYKGVLENGQEIAVKRLSSTSSQGLEQLRNEVALVAKLQHRNLVRLLGCCLEEEEKLLVYEYLPNRSLDKFLYDPVKRSQLDWTERFKIIEGIARGLQYLHEDSRLKVVHRDMKASNILLDINMNSKISDFGLAKLFGKEQTQGATSRIAGTFGYMAPEYAMDGQFSTRSDVYSFGVIVLEIVTGQRNFEFDASEKVANLLHHVWRHWSEGTALQLLDQSLIGKCPIQEVMKCIHIALLCIQEDPLQRPNMSSVLLMLSSYGVTLPPPMASIRWRNMTSTPDSTSRDGNLISTSSTQDSDSVVSELLPR